MRRWSGPLASCARRQGDGSRRERAGESLAADRGASAGNW